MKCGLLGITVWSGWVIVYIYVAFIIGKFWWYAGIDKVLSLPHAVDLANKDLMTKTVLITKVTNDNLGVVINETHFSF